MRTSSRRQGSLAEMYANHLSHCISIEEKTWRFEGFQPTDTLWSPGCCGPVIGGLRVPLRRMMQQDQDQRWVCFVCIARVVAVEAAGKEVMLHWSGCATYSPPRHTSPLTRACRARTRSEAQGLSRNSISSSALAISPTSHHPTLPHSPPQWRQSLRHTREAPSRRNSPFPSTIVNPTLFDFTRSATTHSARKRRSPRKIRR